MKQYLLRFLRLILGLFVFATGMFLAIQANVGVAAWESFALGISNTFGLTYGRATVGIGAAILIIDVILKEKIGVGTILNALGVGLVIDFEQSLDIVPQPENFVLGVIMLLCALVVQCTGSYIYISSGFGAGPRDALMIALFKRLPKVPIGGVRGMIECTVLLLGWLLGAKIGLGTVIAVFGVSFILQGVFNFFRFDARKVVHESIIDSVKKVGSLAAGKADA